MNWIQFVVQWVHVLLGITWFGYTIAMYYLVGPAIAEMPADGQRMLNARLGDIGERVFPIVGGLVLLLGIVRGTLLGHIQSLDALTSAYGITWVVALVATIALFVTGARLIGPAFAQMRTATDIGAANARLRYLGRIDLALFGVVFTCMVLMRFGL